MQITHPGHRLFISEKDIPDSDFPLFLDYVVHVFERFKHYAEEQNSARLSDKSLYIIIDLMKSLNESDDPSTVIPLREDLKNALIRIENKTYGICRVTGKLIEAERLKLVPHATMSMEAKLKQR